MPTVLRIADINRALTRYRRTTVLVGALVFLGLVALDAHAALPEHHHAHGEVTICIAALAVASLAPLGWRRQPTPRPTTRTIGAPVPQTSRVLAAEPPRISARAGPSGLAVLRR